MEFPWISHGVTNLGETPDVTESFTTAPPVRGAMVVEDSGGDMRRVSWRGWWKKSPRKKIGPSCYILSTVDN